MNKLICLTNRLLKEYSPLALLIMVIPFFVDIDNQLVRRLILLLCAGPGLLLAVLNPKAVFKNPVHLLIMLFVIYFSIQDIRGSAGISFPLIRWQIVRAAIIILPAILLSFATPDRKLYAAPLRLILLISAGIAGFSLFSFYADNPFPTARLELMVGKYTHITLTAMLFGFCAVIAGALFLQSGPKITRWNGIELLCLPILMAGMLYTHSRSSFLAFLAALIATLFTLKIRWEKVLCLYAVAAITILIYAVTLHGAESIPKKSKSIDLAPLAKVQQSAHVKIHQRAGGVFATDKGGTSSIHHRLNMWKDHLSRLHRSKKWLIGLGLGRNNFVQEVPPEKQYLYYVGEYGWEIHTHSGYIWALYFGGLIGLGILLALLGTAVFYALRAGVPGHMATALLLFVATIMLVDTKSLLTGSGGITYLLFWIPLGLAAGMAPHNRTIQNETD